MRYVIDACNLIFRDPRLESTLERHGFPAARELFVSLMARFQRAEQCGEIIAVFDGSEKAAHRPRRQHEAHGRVVLIYADPRSDADRYIIDLVADAPQPGAITVVSSDKFIIRNVRGSGAHHLGARDFLRRMRKASQRAADPFDGELPGKFNNGALTEREVEDWSNWFRANGGAL